MLQIARRHGRPAPDADDAADAADAAAASRAAPAPRRGAGRRRTRRAAAPATAARRRAAGRRDQAERAARSARRPSPGFGVGLVVLGFLLERGLDHRHDRVGQRQADQAEQGAGRGAARRAPAPARGRPSSSRHRGRSDSRRRSGRRHRRRSPTGPASMPTEKPASTISTPEMIAPILGRKASRPVRMPSRAAIGTPPTSSSSQVPTPFDRHADQPPRHQPAHGVAHPLGGAVEAVAAVASAASRRRRAGRAAARPR